MLAARTLGVARLQVRLASFQSIPTNAGKVQELHKLFCFFKFSLRIEGRKIQALSGNFIHSWILRPSFWLKKNFKILIKNLFFFFLIFQIFRLLQPWSNSIRSIPASGSSEWVYLFIFKNNLINFGLAAKSCLACQRERSAASWWWASTASTTPRFASASTLTR